MNTIVVAGGCFWGVAEYYRRLQGIEASEAGYAQGWLKQPSYREVCTSTTGHTEAVRLTYDPQVISLVKILEHLARMIDPTSINQQGNDIGPQYRTGVYYQTEQEQAVISNFFQQLQLQYQKPLAVEIEPLTAFYLAEEEHQAYLVKNPRGYCHVDFRLIKPEELK